MRQRIRTSTERKSHTKRTKESTCIDNIHGKTEYIRTHTRVDGAMRKPEIAESQTSEHEEEEGSADNGFADN